MPFYDSPGFGGNEPVEIVNGIKVHKATLSPCPVCGHPTGNCTGNSESPKIIHTIAGLSTMDESGLYFLDEDYYEIQEIVTGVNIKKLIHKKGSMVSLKIATELGLLK